MSWDYIRDLEDCSRRLASWAAYNRGGVGPRPLRSSQLPDNIALDKPAPDAVQVWAPLIVDGERQRDSDGRIIRVSIVQQVTALGKASRRAMRADRVVWPQDVDRMSKVMGCLRMTDKRRYRLLCLDYMTDHAVDHKASLIGLSGKRRRTRYGEERAKAKIAVQSLWNGIAHQNQLGTA